MTAARYDDAGNLVVDTDLSGWTDMGWIGDDSGLTFSRDGDEADLSRTWSTGPLLGAEPTMTIVDEVHHWVNPRTWLPAGIYDEAPITRWAGRKPNRKRRKRR